MWFVILVAGIKSSDRERQMTNRPCGRPHLDLDVVPETIQALHRKRPGNTPRAAWLLVDSCPPNLGGHVCT